jgi:hypothetical protein
MLDTRLKNYWVAVRGLRMATSAQARRQWAKGHLSLSLTMEKDPRLRGRLSSILNQELNQSKPA